MIEPGYYWAKPIIDGEPEGNWDVVLVNQMARPRLQVSVIGLDVAFEIEDYHFGARLTQPAQ